ncbi:MAG TPA: carboxypeptidase regulatory-like domain-containing protein [Pirellulales bacterium]|nr:carboxypeptidase regulatory-like domain-containing protein [Pirellulales bacterium]
MHTITTWFFAAWSSAWGPLALDVVVKATVLLLLAMLAAAMLRRSSAAVRHRVWCLTFAGLLLLPALSAGLPEWRLAVLPKVAGTLRVPQLPTLESAPAESGALTAPRSDSAQMDSTEGDRLFGDPPSFAAPGSPLAEREDYGTRAQRLQPQLPPVASDQANEPADAHWTIYYLVALWLLGALVAAAPLIIGLLRNYLLRRHARPVAEPAWTGLLDELRGRLGLRRQVALYETETALMPMTWGLLSPVVLLPHRARAWTDRLRRFVLLHELAHVKRCDVGFQMLARLACALYWFHPLAWYALRRLRIERELACDDCVVQAGERPSDYAAELLQIARSFQPLRLTAAVPMAQTSNLEHRIRALFDRARSHLPINPRAARLLLLAAAVTVTSIAVIRLAPRPTAEADEPKAAASDDQSDVAQPPSAGAAASPDAILTVRGRVLDPDGKPFVGATIYALGYYWAPEVERLPLTESTSGADGRFKISYRNPKLTRAAQYSQMSGDGYAIAAIAKDFGPGFVSVEKSPPKDLTLRLVRDDVPVAGRVLDLEGRPVAGVRVSVQEIQSPKGDDLSAWLEAIKLGEVNWTAARHLEAALPEYQAPNTEQIVTDAAGRYRVTGIGRERRARLLFTGPRIAYTEVNVVTRRIASVQMVTRPVDKQTEAVYGADFDLTASPTQPIVGTVRDADTGQPLPGVTVANENWLPGVVGTRLVRTTTDTAGRFRLTGLPKMSGIELLAIPNDEQPYFMQESLVSDAPTLEPVTVNFDLHRGIWITGRVTDKATGAPVPALVRYFPFLTNEYAQKRLPEFDPDGNVQGGGFYGRYTTRADGTYRLVGLPGRAIVGAECRSRSYRIGVGAETITGGTNEYGHFPTYRNNLPPSLKWPNTVRAINPPADAESASCDLLFDPGESIKVSVMDTDGKPLAGYKVDGDLPHYGSANARDESSFDTMNLGPDETRTLVIRHEPRKLGKVVTMRLDDHPTRAMIVKLEPCATVAGRLLDAEGDPIAAASLRFDVLPHGDFGKSLEPVGTDKEGRFRRTDVPPGCDYTIYAEGMTIGFRVVKQNLAVQPGTTHHLGDVVLNSSNPQGQTAAQGGAASKKIRVAGRVLDLDDRPIAGARVRVIRSQTSHDSSIAPLAEWAADVRSDAEGRFVASYPRSSAPRSDRARLLAATEGFKTETSLVATADGYGLGVTYFDPSQSNASGTTAPLTVRLPRDTAPLQGRVLDLEGRPVRGARLSVRRLLLIEPNDLESWLAELGRSPPVKMRGGEVPNGSMFVEFDSFFSPFPTVTTDDEGRFKIAGLGADRVAHLELQGPQIVKTWLVAVTRAIEPRPIASGDPRFLLQTCYGNQFDVLAEPSQLIAGRVLDAVSGQPLPDIEVQVADGFLSAVTDDAGRYALQGIAKPDDDKKTVGLRVVPGPKQPYFRTELEAPRGKWLDPITFDIRLRPAVALRGRVTNAETGKPVRAALRYYPFLSNTAAQDYPNFIPGRQTLGFDDRYATDDDGTFVMPALPGRGVVTVVAERGERYPLGEGAADIADLTLPGQHRPNVYHLSSASQDNAIREVNVPADVEDFRLDVRLTPMAVTPLRVVDVDGRELSGFETQGLLPANPFDSSHGSQWDDPSLAATVDLVGPAADEWRDVAFLHRARGLGAVVRFTPDDALDVRRRTVVLQPCATVIGRVVDADGQPVAGAWVDMRVPDEVAGRPDAKRRPVAERVIHPRQIQLPLINLTATGGDGRFRLARIPPSVAYELDGFVEGGANWRTRTRHVKPGETIDVGDIKPIDPTSPAKEAQ